VKFVAGLLLCAIACRELGPTGFTGNEGVLVQGRSGVVRITNERAARVYYFVAERNDLPIIDWLPCTEDQEECAHVEEGVTLTLPYAAIAGYDTGDDQAVLFWWHLVPRLGGGFDVDRLREIVFPL
jgi:hypothetical protein